MSSSLDLARTYTSFSGVDIKVVIDGYVAGTMQAVSYAIQREKAPIYVMGRVDPLSFSRGKRGIAGTMISIMLDQHMINREPWVNAGSVILDKDEIIGVEPSTLGGNEGFQQQGGGTNLPGLSTAATVSSGGSIELQDQWGAFAPGYVDQILPFDISIVAVNEYGRAAQMTIYGCEILNEGSGFSIDDIVIENQMTYICRTILPWSSMGGWGQNGLGGVGGVDINENRQGYNIANSPIGVPNPS